MRFSPFLFRGILLVLCWGILRAASPGEVQARLRSAISLPQIQLSLQVGFDASQGLDAWDPIVDPAAEIVRLERAMTGQPSDATQWLSVARLWNQLNQTNQAQAAVARAVALRRGQFAAKPEDARAMAALGAALPSTERVEAERLLRGAVARAPDDWSCQLTLAKWLLDQVVLPGGYETNTAGLSNPSDSEIQSLAAAKEAQQHFDRAVELAPEQTEPRLGRILYFWLKASGLLDGARRERDGTIPTLDRTLFRSEVLPDLRRAEQSAPEDFRLTALRLWVSGIVSLMDTGEGTKLPDETRREMVEGLAKFRRLAEKSPTPERAAAIWEAQGMIQFSMMQDPVGASESAGRALELQPNRPRAWVLRVGALKEAGAMGELTYFLEQTLRRTNTVEVHLLLMKVYDREKQSVAVAEHVAAALKLEPENLPARACEVALKLRQAKTDDELAVVAELLKKCQDQVPNWRPESDRPRLTAHLWTTAAIYAGLTGDWESAQKAHRSLREHFPEDPYVVAVGEILASAPTK